MSMRTRTCASARRPHARACTGTRARARARAGTRTGDKVTVIATGYRVSRPLARRVGLSTVTS